MPGRVTRRVFTLAGLLGSTVAVSSCAHTFDARTLGANVSLASQPGTEPCAARFRRSQKAIFLIWGLIPASRPSLQNALAGQLTGQAEVRDLRISVRSRFTDLLFTGISAGLIVPRTVTFDGCVTTRAP
ncbi:MAG TPA: hypothetical protein VNL18_12215 [Gemmatimonadales bacterium]|nr:hypothetical protein [Gemmatimonadales bacterium]